MILLFFLYLPFSQTGQTRDYCSLHGSVYVEKDRKNADFLAYVEESEAFADLIVYKESNKLFADRPGLWHFVDSRNFADFTIFFVKDKGLAHFSIHYTDAPSFAGCNR